MRFDQGNQALPGHDLIHLDQEALATGLLTFAGVLGISEGHLLHRDSTVVFVSGGYFTRFGSLLQSFPKAIAVALILIYATGRALPTLRPRTCRICLSLVVNYLRSP